MRSFVKQMSFDDGVDQCTDPCAACLQNVVLDEGQVDALNIMCVHPGLDFLVMTASVIFLLVTTLGLAWLRPE